jgi:hypothetical protein
MSVAILPTFKGYTIDVRLREFRKAIYGEKLEFISFESPKGRKLLAELKSFAHQILTLESEELS